MRKILPYVFLIALLSSCGDDGLPTAGDIAMGRLTVSVTGLDLNDQTAGSPNGQAGFEVTLRNIRTGSIFTALTDETGKAAFNTTPGIYEATARGEYAVEGIAYSFNGTAGQIVISRGETANVIIAMKGIKRSQVVIKELYNGGCLADDGVTKYQFDKYVTLYNNSPQTASLSNLCLGFLTPYNGQSTNNNYNGEGRLTYETDGFTPVLDGIWYFPDTLVIEPYSQTVINIHGAIDNSLSYSQSVDFAHEEYYCMYDPESGYANSKYYPTPSAVIPSSHYLKACRWSQSNAWPLSVTSPALLLFQTHGVAPADYALQVANIWYDGGEVKQTKQCLKIPNQWIVDAIEVFSSGYKDSSTKRLTAEIDAGYVWLTNYQGHSLYRNVDKEATETLPENEGRLVYGYTLGVDGSTDPSGIDAEGSAKNGAHIVYQDTNNSTSDFHERRQCALRSDKL